MSIWNDHEEIEVSDNSTSVGSADSGEEFEEGEDGLPNEDADEEVEAGNEESCEEEEDVDADDSSNSGTAASEDEGEAEECTGIDEDEGETEISGANGVVVEADVGGSAVNDEVAERETTRDEAGHGCDAREAARFHLVDKPLSDFIRVDAKHADASTLDEDNMEPTGSAVPAPQLDSASIGAQKWRQDIPLSPPPPLSAVAAAVDGASTEAGRFGMALGGGNIAPTESMQNAKPTPKLFQDFKASGGTKRPRVDVARDVQLLLAQFHRPIPQGA